MTSGRTFLFIASALLILAPSAARASTGLRFGLIAAGEYRKQQYQADRIGASLRGIVVWHWRSFGVFGHTELRGAHEAEYALGGMFRFGETPFVELGVGAVMGSYTNLGLEALVTVGHDFSGHFFLSLFATYRPTARSDFLVGPLIGWRI